MNRTLSPRLLRAEAPRAGADVGQAQVDSGVPDGEVAPGGELLLGAEVGLDRGNLAEPALHQPPPPTRRRARLPALSHEGAGTVAEGFHQRKFLRICRQLNRRAQGPGRCSAPRVPATAGLWLPWC